MSTISIFRTVTVATLSQQPKLIHITQSNSQSVTESSSTHNTEKLNCNDDDDDWNEDNEILNERAGSFDTMFTSPDVVEDVERTTVYSHIDSGQCDKVYTFAPAVGNKPMSLFLDKFSEELCYPNILWGNSRSDDHEVKIFTSGR